MNLLFRELDKKQGLFPVVVILLLFGLLYSIERKHFEPYGKPQYLISTSWECFCFPRVCWQCPLWPKFVDWFFWVPIPLVTSCCIQLFA